MPGHVSILTWRTAQFNTMVNDLNPGPSGEDADSIGQPCDVGSPHPARVRAGIGRHGALRHLPRQGRSTLARTRRATEEE
jgi:hypothetical protein